MFEPVPACVPDLHSFLSLRKIIVCAITLSNMNYSLPKGTFDILPDQPAEEAWCTSDRWQYLESVIRKTAQDYGFKEIRTPVFEKTELFIRGVGESSDIVTKEMYTFLDRGERSMTLRPEGTAPAMRAFVENNLYNAGPVHKLFYIGPMFRYERPQAGRYRQHHQFGAEAVGIGKPEQDVEVIDLLCELYRRLGLKDLTVMINSIGNVHTRTNYLEALRTYLEPHLSQLSSDSQNRFSKNILRILDSKDERDQKILENAPSILEMLDDESKEHFAKVCKNLENLGIVYKINPKLVRGLDYYNKTVFEITSNALGSQNSIGGGGRYDGLISQFGGPELPACGFGAGMERILQTMMKQNVPIPTPPHPLVFFVGMGEVAFDFCFKLLATLRKENIPAEMDLSGKKVQSGLQRASSLKANYCVVIGEQELQSGTVQLKNMETRENQSVLLSNLVSILKDLSNV